MANIEQVILDHSAVISAQMAEIAAAARSEEDVRHEVNKLLEAFLQAADMPHVGRHEYGLAGGRIDSKYGKVIIEYKDPRRARLGDEQHSPGTEAVLSQLRRRFDGFRKHEAIAPERLFGVGCDGARFVFVRHRGKQQEVTGPLPASPYAVEVLLRALLSLGAQGPSFTPDNLAVRFGSDADLAQEGVRHIYETITTTGNAKAKTFFSQWKILFGEVCGYDVEGRNAKIDKLAAHYGLTRAQPSAMLFSVHTYYAIFIKFLAAEIVSSLSPIGLSAMKQAHAAATDDALLEEMRKLEQGGIWTMVGIRNFLEGDIFSWYLSAWDPQIARVVRNLVRELVQFDPTTLSVEPAESRDLLKTLYQNLFPRSVRHDLGEYYTPDWLAELTLNELGYDGNPDKRLLDPACGSGTFLVMALNRVLKWFEQHRHQCGFDEAELAHKILSNIVGFDLNPLAVMAARTNYLLSIRHLLRHVQMRKAELPVYLCDSIVTPAEYGGLFSGAASDRRIIKTSAGRFTIPTEVAGSSEHIGRYAEALEHCVTHRYGADDFVSYCRTQGLPTEAEGLHRRLYEQLRKLDEKNQNGIWARIIKNAFAPLFVGQVDYVAGNPPWVNWESLPETYRDDMKPLWQRYGLFSLSGAAGRLGGGKKDLSMLFAYGCMDHYLGSQGRLGFVITQSVFKTQGAGDGFRRFGFLPPQGAKVVLRPLLVHDLSALQVFEGATNRTAVLVCEKQQKGFDYPVPYTTWRGRGRVNQDETLEEVLASVERRDLAAAPLVADRPNSPWLTAPSAAIPGITKVLGKSDYVAHAGSCSWLNGVYWVRLLASLPDGALLIENLHDAGKIKVRKAPPTALEPDLIYPLIRGRDIGRWEAEPSGHILLAQDPVTRTGMPERAMRIALPKTYGYLAGFEKELRQRSGFRKYYRPTDPFYSMHNVGPYTLARWKTMWRDMGSRIQVAVVGDPEARPVCPEHHVMAVAFDEPQAAHYLCAALNSAPAECVVVNYTTTTGISAHVLEHVNVPEFDPSNTLHQRLSDLSKRCHAAAAAGDTDAVATLEAEVDRAAAELWGLTDEELAAVHDALRNTPPEEDSGEDEE